MKMKKIYNPIISRDEEFYAVDTNVFTMLLPGRFSVSNRGRVKDNFYNVILDNYLLDDGNLYVILPDRYNPNATYYIKVAALLMHPLYTNNIEFRDGNRLNCNMMNLRRVPCTYQDLDWTYKDKRNAKETEIPRGYISDEDAIRVYKVLLYISLKGNKNRGIPKMTYPDIVELLQLPYNHNDPEALRALTKKFSEIKNREGRFRILLRDFPSIID